MQFLHLFTFITYFSVLLLVVFLTYQKQKTDTAFILGDRKLNFWLTALSAHASDMSSWLFLAYPGQIFLVGMINAWAGVGLTLFMFLNWQFIAPKIRVVTEQFKSLTLNAYFESRFSDSSKTIRITTGIMTLVFFTFYITSGLVAMGLLVESLFGISYGIGIFLGLFIVMLYVFVGGYTTVAWIDLFQGFFLLGVILFIPLYLIYQMKGLPALAVADTKLSLLPDFSKQTLTQAFYLTFGWGLGYFGQPHIITKFMGIRNVAEIIKAKYLGISWQILAIGGATLIGLIGLHFFPDGLANHELVMLEIVKNNLAPFFAGLVLCAILAATTNVMAAQVLIVASSLSEDFYKRLFKKTATPEELLWVSRFSVVLISAVAFIGAYLRIGTIYDLVLFSWTGLGISFGPLLLISLYSKKVNKYGAIAGIITGGSFAALWPYLCRFFPFQCQAMIPGFILTSAVIFIVSYFTKNSNTMLENKN